MGAFHKIDSHAHLKWKSSDTVASASEAWLTIELRPGDRAGDRSDGGQSVIAGGIARALG
jgi:hypothetical protein